MDLINKTKTFNSKRSPIMALLLREKKFLINPDFQLKFIVSLVMIAICSMAIIYLANNYFFETYLKKGEALKLPPDHPFFLMIREQKGFMAKVFLFVSFTISSALCLWGLFYSHKIAGPLYRLEKYFADHALSKKDLKEIKFREEDFFQEIPASINKFIAVKKEDTTFYGPKDQEHQNDHKEVHHENLRDVKKVA